MIDPSPPEKIKKPWNPYDFKDPNCEVNRDRAGTGCHLLIFGILLWSIRIHVFTDFYFCLLAQQGNFDSRHIEGIFFVHEKYEFGNDHGKLNDSVSISCRLNLSNANVETSKLENSFADGLLLRQ